MVLFSSWTHEFGYVLVVKHQNSFISFYKHNSEVFKSKGDYVKSGETIAIIGNSGKYSTGPHLHFELWKGSSPVKSRELYFVLNEFKKCSCTLLHTLSN